MYGGKSFLAIIPARSGSKGLPGKNIKPLCGKPLIAWTIEAGLQSQYLDEVMVTTDSKEIASVAARCGAEVPFLRPAELAQDHSTTFAAVEHALDYYRRTLNREYEYVVLLEPTSPLRERDDIDTMIAKLAGSCDRYDSIISIGEVREHPSIMKKIVNDSLRPFCEELQQTTRRQDNQTAYFPYGVAYIVRTLALLEEQSFYTKRNTYHIIKRYQTYEIDDLYDMLAVENIMRHEWGLG